MALSPLLQPAQPATAQDGLSQMLAMLQPQSVAAPVKSGGAADISSPNGATPQVAAGNGQGGDLQSLIKAFQPPQSLGMDPASGPQGGGGSDGGGSITNALGSLAKLFAFL